MLESVVEVNSALVEREQQTVVLLEKVGAQDKVDITWCPLYCEYNFLRLENMNF